MTVLTNFLLVIALSTLILNFIPLTPKPNAEFNKWKNDFAMHFSPLEDTYRQVLFQNNLLQIQQHNSKPQRSYDKGINQFTHLTQAEFVQLYLGQHRLSISNYPLIINPPPAISSLQTHTPLQDIDWQGLGKISAVKAQGACDAGYAFSSVSLAESYYLFQNKAVILSEQQIIDCSTEYGTYGCQGGSRNGSLRYIREKGLNLMSAYPYRGTKGTCMKTEGDYKAVVGVANVKECDEIRKLLDSNPVTVAVNAQDWQSYRSGVFDGCKSIVVNHDILMTGATLTYWRLKNSWGKTWGEYGYIRLKLGNTCGVCDNPAFGFV